MSGVFHRLRDHLRFYSLCGNATFGGYSLRLGESLVFGIPIIGVMVDTVMDQNGFIVFVGINAGARVADIQKYCFQLLVLSKEAVQIIWSKCCLGCNFGCGGWRMSRICQKNDFVGSQSYLLVFVYFVVIPFDRWYWCD